MAVILQALLAVIWERIISQLPCPHRMTRRDGETHVAGIAIVVNINVDQNSVDAFNVLAKAAIEKSVIAVLAGHSKASEKLLPSR